MQSMRHASARISMGGWRAHEVEIAWLALSGSIFPVGISSSCWPSPWANSGNITRPGLAIWCRREHLTGQMASVHADLAVLSITKGRIHRLFFGFEFWEKQRARASARAVVMAPTLVRRAPGLLHLDAARQTSLGKTGDGSANVAQVVMASW